MKRGTTEGKKTRSNQIRGAIIVDFNWRSKKTLVLNFLLLRQIGFDRKEIVFFNWCSIKIPLMFSFLFFSFTFCLHSVQKYMYFLWFDFLETAKLQLTKKKRRKTNPNTFQLNMKFSWLSATYNNLIDTLRVFPILSYSTEIGWTISNFVHKLVLFSW